MIRLENARRFMHLRVEVSDGREMRPDAVREMSDLRRGIMHMKPEVDLDADFARFAAFVTRCPVVVRTRDNAGTLRGIFVVRWIDGERGGRPWRLILPEYGIFHPSMRGTPAFPWATLRAMVSRPDVVIGDDIMIGGVGYPTAALALEGMFGRLRMRADPDLNDASRDALDRIVEEVAGPRFDASTGRVWMPTRPPRPSERWFRRMASRPTLARYERVCPNWLDGYALPVVCRVDLKSFASTSARSVARALRARWDVEAP